MNTMSEAGKEQILSETNQLPTSFEEMDLSKEVLRAIKDMGFTTPSTVQAKTIPLMMSGADVNAMRQPARAKPARSAFRCSNMCSLMNRKFRKWCLHQPVNWRCKSGMN